MPDETDGKIYCIFHKNDMLGKCQCALRCLFCHFTGFFNEKLKQNGILSPEASKEPGSSRGFIETCAVVESIVLLMIKILPDINT